MKLLDLASNKSFWRGIEYHHENRIMSWEKIDENRFQGKVKGSNDSVYAVMIDTEHPKRSVCNCPFAEGRRVICKHMVALYLGVFPEKEQQMLEYIEEQNRIYEEEYELELLKQEEAIIDYVMSLSKTELREQLIRRMIDDLYY